MVFLFLKPGQAVPAAIAAVRPDILLYDAALNQRAKLFIIVNH